MPTGTSPPRRPPARPALACALARQGITRVDLAAAVGVSTFSVVRVIRGTMRPSQALMERIADVLGEDVEELFALDPALVRAAAAVHADPSVLAAQRAVRPPPEPRT